MRISLLPKAIFPALTQISPEYLHRQGIRLLMLDFDNTIVPYTTDTPSPEMEQWLHDLAQSGIQICVVSNSKKDRGEDIRSRYGLACISHARKPFQKGLASACGSMGFRPPSAPWWGTRFIPMYWARTVLAYMPFWFLQFITIPYGCVCAMYWSYL